MVVALACNLWLGKIVNAAVVNLMTAFAQHHQVFSDIMCAIMINMVDTPLKPSRIGKVFPAQFTVSNLQPHFSAEVMEVT